MCPIEEKRDIYVVYLCLFFFMDVFLSLFLSREMVASLALLADMTAQAKTIEIMISHAHEPSPLC